jgi:mono/diheme cytochrome c family protein
MSHQFALLLIAGTLLLAGCEQSQPPEFRLNMVRVVEAELDEQYQAEVANVLGAVFGTPDDPQVLPEAGLDQTRLVLAAGPAWSDKEGARHGLYRRHCVHCHGITGDGRGPTASFLNPYPRDYRRGVFKFKSTYTAAKPTDDDLSRVLHEGAPGTSMPSFALLPKAEIEALVEYVKYLAIRGEMEAELIDYAYDIAGEEEVVDDKGEPILEDGEPVMRRVALDPAANPDQAAEVTAMLEEVVAPWQEAVDQVVHPNEEQIPKDERSADEVAASIEKGRELFYGAKANCIKCHGPTALGDGQQTDYDDWTKAQVKFEDDTRNLAKSLEDPEPGEEIEASEWQRLEAREEVVPTLLPIRNAIPRNLRKGVYRGGRRRIDLFWRIHAGIPGTPMPGLGGASAGVEGTLPEEDMWHIVDYVLSLPYEPMSGPETQLPDNLLENAR